MKVFVRKNHASSKGRKSVGTFAALAKVSQRVRRKQSAARPAKRIVAEASTPSVPSKGTKVSVKLNVSGNLRGMHNSLNPPDSEHMKRIRAMRRFYNKQMPVLQCNGCNFASTCPKFKAGYECAFLPFLNSHRVTNTVDLVEYMKELCGVNMRRAHLMTLMETLSGSAPSLETTEALAISFEQLKKLHETISATGELQASVESDDSGIVGRLFGGLGNLMDSTRKAQENPIDVLSVVSSQPTKPEAELLLEDKKKNDINFDLVREHTKDELEQATGKKVKRGTATGDVVVSEIK